MSAEAGGPTLRQSIDSLRDTLAETYPGDFLAPGVLQIVLDEVERLYPGDFLAPGVLQIVLDEVERLWTMRDRANAILGSLNRTASAHAVAREILGEGS